MLFLPTHPSLPAHSALTANAVQLRLLTHSALVAHAVQLRLLTHSALTTHAVHVRLRTHSVPAAHAVQVRLLTYSALTAHAVHVRLLALRSPPQGLPSISLRSTHRGMNGAAGVAPADSDLPSRSVGLQTSQQSRSVGLQTSQQSRSVGLQTSQHGAEQQRALDPDADGAAVFDVREAEESLRDLDEALESALESVMESAELDDSVC
jgi:hypothetical protein